MAGGEGTIPAGRGRRSGQGRTDGGGNAGQACGGRRDQGDERDGDPAALRGIEGEHGDFSGFDLVDRVVR